MESDAAVPRLDREVAGLESDTGPLGQVHGREHVSDQQSVGGDMETMPFGWLLTGRGRWVALDVSLLVQLCQQVVPGGPWHTPVRLDGDGQVEQ